MFLKTTVFYVHGNTLLAPLGIWKRWCRMPNWRHTSPWKCDANGLVAESATNHRFGKFSLVSDICVRIWWFATRILLSWTTVATLLYWLTKRWFLFCFVLCVGTNWMLTTGISGWHAHCNSQHDLYANTHQQRMMQMKKENVFDWFDYQTNNSMCCSYCITFIRQYPPPSPLVQHWYCWEYCSFFYSQQLSSLGWTSSSSQQLCSS